MQNLIFVTIDTINCKATNITIRWKVLGYDKNWGNILFVFKSVKTNDIFIQSMDSSNIITSWMDSKNNKT